MSPSPEKVKSASLEPENPVKSVPQTLTEVSPESTPITLLSPLDSYIRERMKEQPKTLKEIEERVQFQDQQPRHRLQLPNFFEKLSADNEKSPGPYIFRWIYKDKRSVDRHLAIGWTFVNRTYFSQAPRYLFSANGGIEVGDAVLGFMPAKKALDLRAAPAKLSQERLRGQMTQTGPDYVLMTGNKKAEHVYQPELGPESAETSEEKVPGILTEGRDFA